MGLGGEHELRFAHEREDFQRGDADEDLDENLDERDDRSLSLRAADWCRELDELILESEEDGPISRRVVLAVPVGCRDGPILSEVLQGFELSDRDAFPTLTSHTKTRVAPSQVLLLRERVPGVFLYHFRETTGWKSSTCRSVARSRARCGSRTASRRPRRSAKRGSASRSRKRGGSSV